MSATTSVFVLQIRSEYDSARQWYIEKAKKGIERSPRNNIKKERDARETAEKLRERGEQRKTCETRSKVYVMFVG